MSLLAPSHPGFFQILATRRAYTTLLYLLLSMVMGIFTFTFAVTGISLSLGLAILIIGIPVGLSFLLATRLLSVAEFHLLKVMVGGEDSPAPPLLPVGQGWVARLKALVFERRTWTSLLYFVLHLPLGIAYFTVFVPLIALELGLLAVPVARIFHVTGSLDIDLGGMAWTLAHPNLAAVLCGLLGLVLIPLTFHLAVVLGRFQVWLARHLLVRT